MTCLLAIFGGLGGVMNTTQAQTRAYVANTNADQVSVIDAQNNTVVASISVGRRPSHIAFTPNGRFAYVTNNGNPSDHVPDSVSVIDTATSSVLTTITVGDGASGVATRPDGKLVYVTNYGSGTVSVIDARTNRVVKTIRVGSAPDSVAVAPNGKFAYVSNLGADTISVIDTVRNIVVASFPSGGDAPRGIAFTSNGNLAYVTHIFSNTVTVVDTTTNTIVATVPSSSCGPNGIAVAPNGESVYVAHNCTPTNLQVIVPHNTSDYMDSVVPRAVVEPEGPKGLAVVSIIRTASNTVVTNLPTGLFLFDVAFQPDGAFAYVTGGSNLVGAVYVIDTQTQSLAATIPMEGGSLGIAFQPNPRPKRKSQCEKDGYKRFVNPTFKNQGQCIKYVMEHCP